MRLKAADPSLPATARAEGAEHTARLPEQLPGFGRGAHSLPLGEGWWRGPAPGSEACRRELEERGAQEAAPLPDGSFGYRLAHHLATDLAGDSEPEGGPRARAQWIAERLEAARAAMRATPPPPQWMAVLNLTPDSFSDGGELPDAAAAAAAGRDRKAEGAAWLDLGAESSRPGAAPVPAAAQLERLLPAIEAVRPLEVPISVDTRSAEVAAACLAAGAAMINDVSGFSDPGMAPLIAERGCRAVLMHMRGTPADMDSRARYRFLLGEVVDELAARVAAALAAGMQADRLVIDPGIGFAKTAAQSFELVAHFGAFRALGFPVLAGPSRKSFLVSALGEKPARERDGGTAGAAALCAAQGAAILRLHRGGAVWDAVKVAAASYRETGAAGIIRLSPTEEPTA